MIYFPTVQVNYEKKLQIAEIRLKRVKIGEGLIWVKIGKRGNMGENGWEG